MGPFVICGVEATSLPGVGKADLSGISHTVYDLIFSEITPFPFLRHDMLTIVCLQCRQSTSSAPGQLPMELDSQGLSSRSSYHEQLRKEAWDMKLVPALSNTGH